MTTTAIPSLDVNDFKSNIQDFDAMANGTGVYTDRFGKERLTLDAFMAANGFEVPVAFASGIAVSRTTQTVTYNDNTYHALPSALPFTTTGTFNSAQWVLLRQNADNVTSATLTITGFTASAALDGAWINFAGRDTIGDGGGDMFRYSASSTQAADGVLVFAPAGGGRLFRQGWTVFGFNGDINVKWAGAKGDGIADDAPACNAAHAAANALKASVSSGYVTAAFSQSGVFYPSGKYRLASTVNTLASDFVRGDRAIILPDAGVTAFQTAAYQVGFDGVAVLGGAKAIRAATSNVDSCKLTIVNSEFQNQTVATFETDATSNSTLISVTATKIQNSLPGAMIGNFQSGDKIVFGQDCWIASGNTLAFQLGTVGNLSTGATLVFDGAFLVPYSSLGTWVKVNEMSNFFAINNTRFGGEPVSGSSTLVETYQLADSSVPISLVISDSTTYCSGPLVKFYGIPNVVVLRNNVGMTQNTNGLYFDSSISAANIAALKSVNAVWDVEQVAGTQFRLFGGGTAAAQQAFNNARATQACGTVLASDKALQIPINSGGFSPANSTVGITNTAGTNSFNAPIHDLVVGATPATASYSQYFNTALNGFAAGTYTAVFDIENVTGEPLEAVFDVGQNVYRRILMKGKNIICIPFYYPASGAQVLGIDLVNWTAVSQRAKVGSIRLFYGTVNINTQNTIMYGTAAPSGTLQAEAGDRVIVSVPASGSSRGYGCSVRGAPGTWISEGNWT